METDCETFLHIPAKITHKAAITRQKYLIHLHFTKKTIQKPQRRNLGLFMPEAWALRV